MAKSRRAENSTEELAPCTYRLHRTRNSREEREIEICFTKITSFFFNNSLAVFDTQIPAKHPLCTFP
jgi:hypothetical protein